MKLLLVSLFFITTTVAMACNSTKKSKTNHTTDSVSNAATVNPIQMTSTTIKKDSIPAIMNVLIHFGSKCCGVPSNKPMLDVFKKFKKDEKLTQFVYYYFGPKGREGEYDWGISKNGLTDVQWTKLMAAIEKVAPTMKDNDGYIQLEKDVPTTTAENGARESVQVEKL